MKTDSFPWTSNAINGKKRSHGYWPIALLCEPSTYISQAVISVTKPTGAKKVKRKDRFGIPPTNLITQKTSCNKFHLIISCHFLSPFLFCFNRSLFDWLADWLPRAQVILHLKYPEQQRSSSQATESFPRNWARNHTILKSKSVVNNKKSTHGTSYNNVMLVMLRLPLLSWRRTGQRTGRQINSRIVHYTTTDCGCYFVDLELNINYTPLCR